MFNEIDYYTIHRNNKTFGSPNSNRPMDVCKINQRYREYVADHKGIRLQEGSYYWHSSTRNKWFRHVIILLTHLLTCNCFLTIIDAILNRTCINRISTKNTPCIVWIILAVRVTVSTHDCR